MKISNNESMKRILFLTPELPYPPVSGGKLKSWKLLEFLAQKYQVSVGSILKEDDENNVYSFLKKAQINNFYFTPVKRNRGIINLIKSYLHQMPLNIFRTHSDYFAGNIKENIYNYDMVISDHYEVFQYIPKDYKGKVILHEHNAYYLMWDRYANNNEHSFSKRLVCYFEAIRVKKYEKNACEQSHLVFASPNDIDSLESIGVNREKCQYTYHLGDDSQLKLPPLKYEETQESLLYVGSLGWEANVDGLLWFIESVWPKLLKQYPQLTFTIIGNNPDQRLIDVAAPYQGITLAGFVENLEPYFQQHRVFVAPLRFGAGMKVKVLNAMCRGIPTVTTSVGSEGMDVTHMKHLAICDDTNSMVYSINELLNNQSAWQILEKNSRQLVKEKYTWKALFSSMHIKIKQLMMKTHKQNKRTNTITVTNQPLINFKLFFNKKISNKKIISS
ncbi:MAG: glycosyltransferase family 4 protein [Thiohalomonas sp.]|nr:glycosyltransferase family 4 protein [Thiohalomonas sp.]